MKRLQNREIRNIGIAAHIDAGKTTLTERMLHLAGLIHRTGDVHDGDTTTDFHPLEKQKGITILAAAVECAWTPVLTAGAPEHTIRIIDTPGHVDFTAEVERSLRVLDGMVAVFCAVGGVQPQTETVWRQAGRYGVPRIAFVNKMDRAGADFARVVAEMRERLGAAAWPVMLPFGSEDAFRGQIDLLRRQVILTGPEFDEGRGFDVQPVPDHLIAETENARRALVVALAEIDETIADLWLSGADPPAEQLDGAVRRSVLKGRFVPVIPGAAYKHRGVHALLDAVTGWLPAPEDRAASDAAAPFAGLVFKTTHDEHAGRLAWLRVYSGTLHKGDTVALGTSGRTVRAGRLLRLLANRREDIESCQAGDVVAVAGLRDVRTGDTLCAREAPVDLEPPAFPEPVVTVAIEPESRGDQEKMARALASLADDDPTFRFRSDAETGQLVISGMGELHLAVQIERMRLDHGVTVRAGRPRISCRETVTRSAEGEGRQVKRTGGPGQYGHVILTVAPGEPGSGVVINDAVTGGAIPSQFIAACRKGVAEALGCGPLGGFAVTDIIVTLRGGSSHNVDSNDLAFRIAAEFAVRDALEKAACTVLEPWMSVLAETPADHLGDVLGELGRRRSRIIGTDTRGAQTEVRAEAPLSELFGLADALRAVTRGRASAAVTPLRMEPVTADVRDRLLRQNAA